MPVTSEKERVRVGDRQCAKCRATVAAPVKLIDRLLSFCVFSLLPPSDGGWAGDFCGWEQKWRSGRRKREEGPDHPCVPSTTSRRQ